MNKVFISYSRTDEVFARQLAQSLTDLGSDVWLDVVDIKGGENWSNAIQNGLEDCEMMLVIISPESMASDNVKDEWQYYRDKRKPVIPVRWRPTDKIHYQLSRSQYIDFYDRDYAKALSQLQQQLMVVSSTTPRNNSFQLTAEPVLARTRIRAKPRWFVGTVVLVPLLLIIVAVLALTRDRSNNQVESKDTYLKQTFSRPGQIYAARFSADARFVAAGGNEDSVMMWDVWTGDLIRTFDGHTMDIEGVDFDPNERYIVTASSDNTAKLWEVTTGALVRTFEGHTSFVHCAEFSPDGKYVATSSADNTARLWEVSTGALIRTFEGHTDWVLAVAFSPDGKYLLTGSMDDTAQLWLIETGEKVRSFIGHTSNIMDVVYSLDRRFILTGSNDGTAKWWDVDTGNVIRSFDGHGDSILSVALTFDTRYMLTGGAEHTAKLWEVETGNLLRTFEGHTDMVDSVSFSPDSRMVLTGSRDGTVRLWESGLYD